MSNLDESLGIRASAEWRWREARDREQSRLARCAAESRRLSLEECCYWLCLANAARSANLLVYRQPWSLHEEMRDYRKSARYWLTLRRRSTRPSREVQIAREYLLRAWLCREALRRIEEERR